MKLALIVLSVAVGIALGVMIGASLQRLAVQSVTENSGIEIGHNAVTRIAKDNGIFTPPGANAATTPWLIDNDAAMVQLAPGNKVPSHLDAEELAAIRTACK